MSTVQVPQVAAGGRLRRLEFEALLADLSSRFVNLPPHQVDRAIEDALRHVCEHLGLDLAVLWQWSDSAPGVAVPTHAYPALEGLRPHEPMTQRDYPWIAGQMLAGREIVVAALDELPDEADADRESARRGGDPRQAYVLPGRRGHARGDQAHLNEEF
jgi:hypothetical protein